MNHAQEQAAEFASIFAPRELRLDDGTVIVVPPHPNLRMFDDDAQAKLEALEVDIQENCDREPDIYIPEQKVKDNAGNEIILPAETRPGALKQPYRKKKKPLDPPYTVQVVKIALGDDYGKLRAGTIGGKRGSAAHVWRLWNEQGAQLANRADADPKSEGSSGDLAETAPPDSQ